MGGSWEDHGKNTQVTLELHRDHTEGNAGRVRTKAGGRLRTLEGGTSPIASQSMFGLQ